MTKSFIEEVREYVSAGINPFGRGHEMAEALIAIDDIIQRWKNTSEEDLCNAKAMCLIMMIVEGEQK